MKNRNGSAWTGMIIFVAFMAAIAVVMGALMVQEQNARIGRNIDSPTIGQVYLVTAVDTEMNLIVAMPYKITGDKDGVKTDRRILLKVANKAINEKDIWFIKSADGIENIIPSPILTKSAVEAKTGKIEFIGF